MASLSREKNRIGFRLSFIDATGRRRSIWIGDVPDNVGQSWKRHVEHLIAAAKHNEPPSSSTMQWLGSLTDRDHAKLANAAFVQSRESRAREDKRLGEWLDEYIAERQDVKASTTETYEKAKDSLLAYFESSKPLRSLRPEDAQRWRIWLATKGNRRDKKRSTMADATVRRRTSKAKQFFAEAVKRGYIDANPFDGLLSTLRPNAKRQRYVTSDDIEKCISACPDTQWKTILALARYGGLRCPSELLRLTWADVDLAAGQMVIHSSKTEHLDHGGIRVCPIFPELRPYLECARREADPSATYVITRYRASATNLRTYFLRIIKTAGLEPWPKLFQNLRASRETELMGKFPAKDVASWIGNSVPVAMAHYAMPLASSFEAAKSTATCGVACGDIRALSVDISTGQDQAAVTLNTDKKWLLMSPDALLIGHFMGDTELESVTSAV